MPNFAKTRPDNYSEASSAQLTQLGKNVAQGQWASKDMQQFCECYRQAFFPSRYAVFTRLPILQQRNVSKFYSSMGYGYARQWFRISNFYLKNAACFVILHVLWQGWAISGPRATCGQSQRFQWPAKAFRKNLKIWNFLQLHFKALFFLRGISGKSSAFIFLRWFKLAHLYSSKYFPWWV